MIKLDGQGLRTLSLRPGQRIGDRLGASSGGLCRPGLAHGLHPQLLSALSSRPAAGRTVDIQLNILLEVGVFVAFLQAAKRENGPVRPGQSPAGNEYPLRGEKAGLAKILKRLANEVRLRPHSFSFSHLLISPAIPETFLFMGQVDFFFSLFHFAVEEIR